jgi:predicted Zn-dependent protease
MRRTGELVIRISPKIIIAAAVALVLLSLSGAAAYYGMRWHRDQQLIATKAHAENLYERGEWLVAKRNFALYLQRFPKDVETLERYAEASMRISDNRVPSLRDAGKAYLQILQIDPKNIPTQDKFLALQDELGEASALEYYSELYLRDRPDDPMLLNYRARAVDALGRNEDAISAYEGLLENGVAEPDVYFRLARLYHNRGQIAVATKFLDSSVDAHPDDPNVRLQRGRFRGFLRDFDEAAIDINAAVAAMPDDPDALQAQCQLAAAQSDWDTVLRVGEALITLDSQRAEPYLILAQAYSQTDQRQKAIETLQRPDEITRSRVPDLLVTLADLQITDGQLEASEETLETYGSTFGESRILLDYFEGRRLILDEDYEDAISKLAYVVGQRPEFGPAQIYLTLAYFEAGQVDSARITLETYLENNPHDANARELRRRLFGGEQRLEELLPEAQVMLRTAGGDPREWVASALSLLRRVSRTESKSQGAQAAQGLLERAVELEPSIPGGYRGLIDLHIMRGDWSHASGALAAARAAGVPAEQLQWGDAAIALGAGDVDAAFAVFDSAAGQPDADPEDVRNWIAFFLSRGSVPLAERVLQHGLTHLVGDAQYLLQAERVAFLAQTDRLDDASAALDSLQSDAGTNSAMEEAVDAARLEVARAVLRLAQPDQRDVGLALVDLVLKRDARHIGALALRGQYYMLEEPPALLEAQRVYDGVVAQDSRNLPALAGLAAIASQRGDLPRASLFAEKAAMLAPDHVRIQLQLAELQLKLNRRFEGQRTLEHVLELEPDNFGALALLANSYLDNRRMTRADEVVPRLAEMVGDDPSRLATVTAIRSRLLAERGEGGQAEELLRTQLAKDPSNFATLKNLANTVQARGRTEEAVRLLSDYAEAHASNPDAWVALARFHMRHTAERDENAALQQASTALTRALLLDESYPPALRQMIQVQIRQGNREEGLALCRRYLESSPDDAEVQYQAAALLVQRPGGADEALEAIENAIQLERRTEYVRLRGYIRVALKDYEGALDDLQPLMGNTESTTAQTDLMAAEAFFGVGQVAEARALLAAAERKFESGQRLDTRRLERLRKTVADQGEEEAA